MWQLGESNDGGGLAMNLPEGTPMFEMKTGVTEVAAVEVRDGYEVRTERTLVDTGGLFAALADRPQNPDDDQPRVVEVRSCYTPEGHYIGDETDARWLVERKGIHPEVIPGKTRDDGRALVCSIGFCKREQKWYGWSHRCHFGFGIGDRVDNEDHICATEGWTEEYLREHPEARTSLPVGFEAKTLDDAKRMAIAFAEAVS